MRKIERNCTLATEYHTWMEANPTKAYSSSHKYYYDVLYQLLILQRGLCAYTEKCLISPEKLEEITAAFADGKLNVPAQRPDVAADIEHFSKAMKVVSSWNWDNLFTAYSPVNRKKNHLEDKYGIDDILKPDRVGYSAENYLMYERNLHVFIPNVETLDDSEQERVRKMILVLGLNNDGIVLERKEYLRKIKEIESLKNVPQVPTQYFTAYSMME